MENQDIRWIQRFSNYKKVLLQLKKFINKGELNELEEQGIIQVFEYTYELAWNVIKDYYQNQGVIDIQGSRDAFRMAFNRELIADGELWMRMIESRIKSSHTYNEEIASEIAESIFNEYFDAFLELEQKLDELKLKL